MKKFIEAGRNSSNIDEILETGNTNVSEHVKVDEANNCSEIGEEIPFRCLTTVKCPDLCFLLGGTTVRLFSDELMNETNIIPKSRTFLDKKKLNFQIRVYYRVKLGFHVSWQEVRALQFGCQIRVQILLFRVEFLDSRFWFSVILVP